MSAPLREGTFVLFVLFGFVLRSGRWATPVSLPAFSDDRIRRRLWIVLVLYETAVIAVVVGAGLNIALMGGGSLVLAAPLVLIACAEALRIPLSAMATRLRLSGRLLAAVALVAIAVGSAEGLAVAFEAFLQNRVTEIMHAAHDVERARQVVDKAASDRALNDISVAGLTDQVKQLDAEVALLAHSMPTPPAGSNRTCTWKGQRVTCAADAAAIAAYREAMKSYDARLAGLVGQRSALQVKVDAARQQTRASSPEAARALLEAKEAFEEKTGQSPVWRLTAAIFNEDVAAVTEAQFNTVKKFATGTLAITFATLSMVVSVVAHAQLRSAESKLARALRKMLAARRKTLRRIRETVRTEIKERVRVLYVPVSATGKVIDPDGKRGEPADRSRT